MMEFFIGVRLIHNHICQLVSSEVSCPVVQHRMQPQKIASLPLSLVSLPARDVYKHQYGGLLAHAHARNKILPPRIHIAGAGFHYSPFFCPDEQFTSGECVLPQKCCSTSASRKMGSYRRLFSFRKKLTNTRLSILGHHLTGGAPNMGQKRFSTDIFRRPRQSKGCRQAREYTRR